MEAVAQEILEAMRESTKTPQGEFPDELKKYIDSHWSDVLVLLPDVVIPTMLIALKDLAFFSYRCGARDTNKMTGAYLDAVLKPKDKK